MQGNKIKLRREQDNNIRNQELSLTNSDKLQLISQDDYQNNGYYGLDLGEEDSLTSKI